MNPLLAREFVAPLRLGNSPHEHAERLASLGPREWEAALDWLDLAGLTLVFWTRLKESGTEGVVPSHLRSRLDRNLADHCLRVTEMGTEADTINADLLEFIKTDSDIRAGINSRHPRFIIRTTVRKSLEYRVMMVVLPQPTKSAPWRRTGCAIEVELR